MFTGYLLCTRYRAKLLYSFSFNLPLPQSQVADTIIIFVVPMKKQATPMDLNVREFLTLRFAEVSLHGINSHQLRNC